MIAQAYPEAVQHLTAAQEAKRRMAALWGRYLDEELIDFSVVTDPRGDGRITVYVEWPAGVQAELTRQFRECTSALWGCLDALVSETVEALGILQRPHAPERPRFFPVADSVEGFDALLAESCLDGVLIAHHQLVRDCQPFRIAPDDAVTTSLRAALRTLLEWTNQLEDGAQLAAWATPVDPELNVTTEVELLALVVAEPGPLDPERTVATYRLAHYTPGHHTDGTDGGVTARANTYVDLAFPAGHTPSDPADTFDQRVGEVIHAVARVAAIFAAATTRVRGTRRVAQTPTATGASASGDRTGWVHADQSPRGWSAAELDALSRSDFGVGVVTDAGQLTLLVTTANGVHERVIPAASALNPHVRRGAAAEAATHNAAATWGLPDFVILPQAEHRGSRNREISDGLIVVGDRGVVLQVKSRDSTVDRPDREVAWVDKKITQAARQVDGTVRRLRAGPCDMINGRGRPVSIDGPATSWIGVVIIDHPEPPSEHPLTGPAAGVPIVVLLRRDWEFLFHQLRSTRAVVDYLYRVEGSTPLLGGEPERYFELAEADADAVPGDLDEAIIGERRSVPLLPAAPAGHDDDAAHGVLRMICEDITNSPSEYGEADLTRVLAAIDRLPVGYRTDVGRFLLTNLQRAASADPERVFWNFRTVRRELEVPQLGFGVCSRFDDTILASFRSWVLLRHHERGAPEQLTDALSVGVLLTPRADDRREWDTSMIAVQGDPGLTSEELAVCRRLWNHDPPGADVDATGENRPLHSPPGVATP